MAEAPEQPKSIRERVTEILDHIRPRIQADGGDLEFVDLDDQGVVSVRLHGACRGCPGAQMTLKMGVERFLRQQVPEVTSVVCVPS